MKSLGGTLDCEFYRNIDVIVNLALLGLPLGSPYLVLTLKHFSQ